MDKTGLNKQLYQSISGYILMYGVDFKGGESRSTCGQMKPYSAWGRRKLEMIMKGVLIQRV